MSSQQEGGIDSATKDDSRLDPEVDPVSLVTTTDAEQTLDNVKSPLETFTSLNFSGLQLKDSSSSDISHSDSGESVKKGEVEA